MAYVGVKKVAIKMWEGNLNLTVQNKMFTGKVNMTNKANVTTGNAPAVTGMSVNTNSNPLIDMNYGNLLVKSKNTAFTGGAKTATTFGKAISKMLFNIDIEDICLVTKSKTDGVKLMTASLDAFGQIPPGKTFVLSNPNIDTTFAVRRLSNKTQEIINLADEPLYVTAPDGKKSYALAKGDYLPLISGDTIVTNKGSIEIPLINEIGFNKPKVGNDLERFAEEGPLYKAGFGPREERPEPAKKIGKIGFVINELTETAKAKTKKITRALGYGKNEENQTNTAAKATKQVGFKKPEEVSTIDTNQPKAIKRETPANPFKQPIVIKGFSQNK